MKPIKIMLMAIAIVLVSAVSFMQGREYEEHYYSTVYYEAACRMSDVIRCYHDHLEDSIFTDYGLFEEVMEDCLSDEEGRLAVTLSDYVWGY